MDNAALFIIGGVLVFTGGIAWRVYSRTFAMMQQNNAQASANGIEARTLGMGFEHLKHKAPESAVIHCALAGITISRLGSTVSA